MEININGTSTLSQIQEAFKTHFPYLKLAFFKVSDNGPQQYNKAHLITEPSTTIQQLSTTNSSSANISINGHLKVSSLEQHFMEQFGIPVQVFRKSGATWLQTTTSDNETLTEQNSKGMAVASPAGDEDENNFDLYHEQV